MSSAQCSATSSPTQNEHPSAPSPGNRADYSCLNPHHSGAGQADSIRSRGQGEEAWSLRAVRGNCVLVSHFELGVPLPPCRRDANQAANFEGANEIPLRQLVKEALRMRLSRLVEEVRQEECLALHRRLIK